MRFSFRIALPVAIAIALALSAGAPPAPAYEERAPEPTASYPSLETTRDSLGVLIGRVVREISGPHGKAFEVSRKPTRFGYWYAGDSARGWVYDIVVKD